MISVKKERRNKHILKKWGKCEKNSLAERAAQSRNTWGDDKRSSRVNEHREEKSPDPASLPKTSTT